MSVHQKGIAGVAGMPPPQGDIGAVLLNLVVIIRIQISS